MCATLKWKSTTFSFGPTAVELEPSVKKETVQYLAKKQKVQKHNDKQEPCPYCKWRTQSRGNGEKIEHVKAKDTGTAAYDKDYDHWDPKHLLRALTYSII